MRKILSIVATGLLSIGPAHASSPVDGDLFDLAAELRADGNAFAEWIQAIQQVAHDCGDRIDEARLRREINELSRKGVDYREALRKTAKELAQGSRSNQALSVWINGRNVDYVAGCDTADKLWGPDGVQFPGVLIKLPEPRPAG